MGFLESNLAILRAIASIRTPLLDAVMAAVTHLGEETLFMVVALAVFWCIDKRKGYFLLLVGFAGTTINQTLKIMFRIPRPWMLDPNFQIVEAARAEATGFSFPSGHTQNAVGTFGSLAACEKRTWLRAAFIVLALLIAFSRLYLGVHTPLDVGVSLLVAAVLIAVFYPVYRTMESHPNRFTVLWVVLIVAAVVFRNYAQTRYALAVSSGTDAETMANFTSAVKNAYCMLGASVGALVVYLLDERCIRFETKAVWWAQLIKLGLGLILVVAVKSLLKAPLVAAFGPNSIGDAIRYGVMVLVAGAVWPLTFRFFARLGRK